MEKRESVNAQVKDGRVGSGLLLGATAAYAVLVEGGCIGSVFATEADLAVSFPRFRPTRICRHAQNISDIHASEAVRLQYDSERLIPGHVDEPNGDPASDVVGDYDVFPADLREHA